MELVRAVVSAEELEALNVTAEEAGKAIARNFFPVIKKHIGLAVQYGKDCFEAALVDEITQGEGPISCVELLEKVKEATQKIKELVGRVHKTRLCPAENMDENENDLNSHKRNPKLCTSHGCSSTRQMVAEQHVEEKADPIWCSLWVSEWDGNKPVRKDARARTQPGAGK